MDGHVTNVDFCTGKPKNDLSAYCMHGCTLCIIPTFSSIENHLFSGKLENSWGYGSVIHLVHLQMACSWCLHADYKYLNLTLVQDVSPSLEKVDIKPCMHGNCHSSERYCGIIASTLPPVIESRSEDCTPKGSSMQREKRGNFSRECRVTTT